jgi:hypothetical protein
MLLSRALHGIPPLRLVGFAYFCCADYFATRLEGVYKTNYTYAVAQY